MKKLILLLMMFSLSAVPAFAASTVQVGYPGAYSTSGYPGYGMWQTGVGGEFTLNPLGTFNPLILAGYDSRTKNIGADGTFQTFCVEENEYIYPYATTYSVVFNDRAIYGGVGGGGPSGEDPLSVGAAYLYFQFATGALSVYDYSPAGRHASAAELQNAIWCLEEEGGYIDSTYQSLLTANVGPDLAAWQADNNGQYNVQVLNMWDSSGNPGQDQLVLTAPSGGGGKVPVPGAVLLGSIGAGLVGWLKKRRTL